MSSRTPNRLHVNHAFTAHDQRTVFFRLRILIMLALYKMLDNLIARGLHKEIKPINRRRHFGRRYWKTAVVQSRKKKRKHTSASKFTVKVASCDGVFLSGSLPSFEIVIVLVVTDMANKLFSLSLSIQDFEYAYCLLDRYTYWIVGLNIKLSIMSLKYQIKC